jgi:hypothetical protein
MGALVKQTDNSVTAETMEAVVVGGDLSRLSPPQRLEWYRGRCEAAGLDPRTQPFQYISLQGKLTLYATKAATDQLIAAHRLGVQIVDRKMLDCGIYEVVVRVTFPDGRTVEDVGAVPIAESLRGEALSNSVMKAVTKAKRRTVLSACGLGMLDAEEVESAGARVVTVDQRGEIIGGSPDPVGGLLPPAPNHPGIDSMPETPAAGYEPALSELFAGDLEPVVNTYLADEVAWQGRPWLRHGQDWRQLTPVRMKKILERTDAFMAKVDEYKQAMGGNVDG